MAFEEVGRGSHCSHKCQNERKIFLAIDDRIWRMHFLRVRSGVLGCGTKGVIELGAFGKIGRVRGEYAFAHPSPFGCRGFCSGEEKPFHSDDDVNIRGLAKDVEWENISAIIDSFKKRLRKNPRDFDCMLGLSRAYYLQSKASNGSYDMTIKHLKKFITSNPNSIEAVYRLGIVQIEAGKLNSAIKSFQRAIEIDPEFAEAHNILGWIHWKKFQQNVNVRSVSKKKTSDYHTIAIECFRRAIELKPDYANAYNNLGSILVDQGSLDEGIEMFQKCLSLNTTETKSAIHYNLSIALEKKRELNAALAHYKTAFLIDPSNADIANNYALCLVKNNQFFDAMELFRRAIEICPTNMDFYANLAITQLKCDDLIGAINTYEDIILKNPTSYRLWTELGLLYHELANSRKKDGSAKDLNFDLASPKRDDCSQVFAEDQAISNLRKARNGPKKDYMHMAYLCYAKALEIDSQDPTVYKRLGSLYADRECWSQAQSYFEKVLSLSPKDPEALTHLGAVMRQQNDLTQCILLWKEAIKISPNYSLPWEYLAIHHGELGNDWDESIKCLEKVIHLNPNNEMAKLNLAVALHHAGKTESSLEHFEQLAFNSKNYLVHYNYLTCLLQSGNSCQEKINYHYDQIKKLNPEFCKTLTANRAGIFNRTHTSPMTSHLQN